MKLLRYGLTGQEKPGLLDANGTIRDLSRVIADLDGGALSPVGLQRLAALDPETLPAVPGAPRTGVPVANVGKFIAIGLNYTDHAKEAGMAIPTEPVVFMKATSCLIGPNDDVIRPKRSTKMDWEVELGVVLGAKAQYVPAERALDYVAGYCVVNDVSERNFQIERGGQWDKGKSFDTFGPVGPWLVTKDEVGDVHGLAIWLDVNGERMQTGNTRTMIFNCAEIVSYLSEVMTLMPGDLICTGTPPGVGMGMKPPRYLQIGDVMTSGHREARRTAAETCGVSGPRVMNRLDLENKRAVVVAERLAVSGARVALWDRDAANLDRTAAAMGPAAQAIGLDVSSESAIADALEKTLAQFGGIDALVNNAGISGPNMPTWEYPVDDWRRVLDVNLTGVFLCCRAIVPHMIASRCGRIVNVASVAGKEGNPNAPAYSASKAAVIALTKSLGKELARTGVVVNCVTPGAVRTAIFDQMSEEHVQFMLSRIPMGASARLRR